MKNGARFNISIVRECQGWYHSLTMRFIWENLPVFLIWLIGLSILNNALHHITPPMEDVILPALFPLAVSLVLMWFAMKGSLGRGAVKRYLAWCSFMIFLYFTPLMHHASMPMGLEEQRLLYEMSAFVQFVIIVLHARTWLEKWDWGWVFGITLIFGFILENGGIIIGFFSEPDYRIYLPGLPAPVATAVGWLNVLYCAFFAVERLLPKMHPIARGLVCALIGLSLDISFDPVATKLSWWVWNPGLDAGIMGVPVINFIAWFWAIFPYTSCYYWIRQRQDMEEARKVKWFIGLLPVILMAELAGVTGCLALMGDAKALSVFKDYLMLQVF